MKTAGKIGLCAAVLCVISASASVGLFLLHRNQAPGQYGKTLEFRVSALNTEHFDQFNRAREGFDVFSSSQAREIAETGIAPAGFKWMSVSNFYLMETGSGIDPKGILTVIDGHIFLLVTDRPEMILTHAATTPVWGVKSVEMTSTYIYGPVVKTVQIEFDNAALDLLRQFTEKYVWHSIAVIVDGQVIANFGLLTPMRRGVVGLSSPEGGGKGCGNTARRTDEVKAELSP
jgi:hypothetical protein